MNIKKNVMIVLFCTYGLTFTNQIKHNVRIVSRSAVSEQQEYQDSGEEDLDIIEFDTEGETINMEEHKLPLLLDLFNIYVFAPLISLYNKMQQDF